MRGEWQQWTGTHHSVCPESPTPDQAPSGEAILARLIDEIITLLSRSAKRVVRKNDRSYRVKRRILATFAPPATGRPVGYKAPGTLRRFRRGIPVVRKRTHCLPARSVCNGREEAHPPDHTTQSGRSGPRSSHNVLPKRLDRFGIAFALLRGASIARWCADGTQNENDMHDFQTHVFRPAVTAMMLLLASPLMAQAPSGQPSTRASVLDQAREALTNQSVPPERSTIERGLYWYDNQNVLNKIFGGWKGIRLGEVISPPGPA